MKSYKNFKQSEKIIMTKHTVITKIKSLNNSFSFWKDCQSIINEYVRQIGGYDDCDIKKWQIIAEQRFDEIRGEK